MDGTNNNINSEKWPKVSVIIASYNSQSQSFLAECLKSVSEQHYRGELEIIVSDGGSTDESIEISKKYGAKVIHNPKKTELGFEGGKNLAINHSTGELIAIVDADNILMEKDYIEQLAKPFIINGNISMSFPSPYIPSKKECNLLCKYFCCLERDLFEKYLQGKRYENWIEIVVDDIIVPNGAMIKKESLELIGGWDYDTEVGYRLVTSGLNKFAYVYTVHRWHIEMIRYKDVWKKFERRIVNQIKESKIGKKGKIQKEINTRLKNPVVYLMEEFINPLGNTIKKRELCYLNSIPVFVIKSILILKYFKSLSKRNNI
ncbi:MAG: glycosyltransferase [Thermoplasmata archaeon]